MIDDEPAIRESLVYALERDGFATMQAATLKEARPASENASLIVLDLMLPDGRGLDFLRDLRAKSTLPVIILTSRDEEPDRVVGLEMGADDYVTKPFSPRELVARVKTVLRGVQSPKDEAGKPERIEGPKGLTIEQNTRRFWVKDQEVQLTKIEFDLISVLLQSPGRVFERSKLLDRVWGTDCIVGDRTVDVHFKSLRNRIREAGGDPDIIETVRGVGYRLGEGSA